MTAVKRAALAFAAFGLLALHGWCLPLPEGAIARLGAGYLVGAYAQGETLWATSSIALEEWDLFSGELVREIPLAAVPKFSSFTEKGTLVALAAGGGGISVRALPAGDEIASFALGEEVTALALSPDGRLVAAGGIGGRITVWDIPSEKELFSLVPFDWDVGLLAFTPDGEGLVAASAAGSTLYLYDVRTGERVGGFPWNRWGVRRVAFSPDDRLLAIAAGDGVVRVWDVKERRLLRNLEVGPVASIAFTQKGLLAVGTTGHVFCWDPETWRLLEDFTVPGETRYATLVPGERLILHPPTGPLEVWDLEGGERIASLGRGRYLGRFTAAEFSPDGNLLSVAATDGTIRVWRTAGWEEAFILRGPGGAVNAIAFSPDGKRLLSGGNDGRVRIWTLGGKEKLEFVAHTRPISDVDFAPDGKSFLTASVDETVRIWDAGTGELVRTLWKPVKVQFLQPLVRDAIYAARFSPEGDLIAAGSEDETVRLWDTETGVLLALLRKHRGVVDCVAFTPDGALLASGDTSGMVVLWDVQRRRARAVLRRGGEPVYALAFSPDGESLLVGGAAGTLELYAVRERALVRRLRGHVGDIFGVAFHPNGKLFVSASTAGTVLVWDMDTLGG